MKPSDDKKNQFGQRIQCIWKNLFYNNNPWNRIILQVTSYKPDIRVLSVWSPLLWTSSFIQIVDLANKSHSHVWVIFEVNLIIFTQCSGNLNILIISCCTEENRFAKIISHMNFMLFFFKSISALTLLMTNFVFFLQRFSALCVSNQVKKKGCYRDLFMNLDTPPASIKKIFRN